MIKINKKNIKRLESILEEVKEIKSLGIVEKDIEVYVKIYGIEPFMAFSC